MKRIGTQKSLNAEERGRLIDELKYWQLRSEDFYGVREQEERAFMQIWKGQTVQGVRKDEDDEEAWPFDGASDQRVRWGDTAFQEYLSLMLVALDTCKVEVTCDGSKEGAARARAIQRVIGWCRQKLGAKWYVQISALLRYALVDTPAVAAMDVGWAVKRTMGVVRLEREALKDEYAAWRGNQGEVSEVDAAQEWELAVNGAVVPGAVVDGAVVPGAVVDGGEEEAPWQQAASAFLVTQKRCREEDCEEILAALGEEGECEALCEAATWEGPEIRALRFGDDFMIPAMTEEFETADVMFRQQWMTEAELRELAASEEWDAEWVEDTLAHKGANFYDTRDYEGAQDLKNQVNVVWCYQTEVGDDGTVTRYVSVLSQADGSAFGKRVVRARRGRWEAVFFRREALANNCLASRGLAHLCAPDAGLAKTMKDYANNNAIISSLPMIKAKGARVRNVMYEPFGVTNMGVNDDVAFMQPPAYPAAAKEQVKALKDDLLAYLGLTNGETDVSTRTSSFTAFMLSQFGELYKRLVEAAQDYASDEALASVTGESDQRGLRHEDLDGDFQLMLRFNPANMNHKDLIERVTALGQVIAPLDANNAIDREAVLRNAFVQLFPEITGDDFRDREAVAADEVADEEQNFVKIKSGITPQVDVQGRWNYQARLEWHQRMQQENPDAIAEMTPRSQEIYAAYLERLQAQYQQYVVNAQTGRTGVENVE